MRKKLMLSGCCTPEPEDAKETDQDGLRENGDRCIFDSWIPIHPGLLDSTLSLWDSVISPTESTLTCMDASGEMVLMWNCWLLRSFWRVNLPVIGALPVRNCQRRHLFGCGCGGSCTKHGVDPQKVRP